MLVSQPSDDTETSLQLLFGNRILHRDSAVQEVILDQKEDINRYAACEIDERPQVANQIRRPLFALSKSAGRSRQQVTVTTESRYRSRRQATVTSKRIALRY